MTRKPTKSGNIRLPPGSDLPSDKNVTLPRQIKHEAAVANALATGQPVPSKPKPVARQGFPHSDAEIDKGLQRLKALQTNDPELEVIRSLAEEGARHIKARRRGAQQPRENSYEVTRRMEAVLQSFREKSSKLQKYPTGEKTIAAVRQSVIQKLGVEDDDEAISEDLIRKDIQLLKQVIRLVQEGIIPSGTPTRQSGIPDKTRQEMRAGKKAVAKAAALKSKAGARGKNKKAK